MGTPLCNGGGRGGKGMSGTKGPFGARVQFLRKRVGLQQADLARAARLSLSYISMIEQGQRTPSYTAAQRLAEALGVSHAALYQQAEVIPIMDNGAHWRLVAFAREAALTRKQVERLIAVAKALFGKAAP